MHDLRPKLSSLLAPLASLGLLAALVSPGCTDEPAAPPVPAPRVLVQKKAPEPTPLPRNPEKRKLDEEGNLIESMNDLYGYRLPMGVKRVEQQDGSARLHISTRMERIVRFYTARGYQVIAGRGGDSYVVRHTTATLEDAPNAEDLLEARLYLRPGPGRNQELRFYGPPRVEPPLPDPPPRVKAGPPPPDDAPPEVKRRYERLVKWYEDHPGEPPLE